MKNITIKFDELNRRFYVPRSCVVAYSASTMQFTSLTRSTEIGANSYVIRTGGKSIILDCGLHPVERGMAATPDYAKVPEGSVDAIIITHAHQDHIGSLPILTRREQKARVFITEATSRIGEIMLHNSSNVMARQREAEGITDYPLFTHRGIDFSKLMWMPTPVGQPYTVSGERGVGDGSEPTLEFFHAGHILGSVGVLLRSPEGKTLFYTGDVNFDRQTLMAPAKFPESDVDILVIETTRGDSPQRPDFTRGAEEERFAAAILAAFERGGSVTIPVFALGKSQEILALLWGMTQSGQLPETPIYIGGLSTKVTTAYDHFAGCEDRTHNDLHLLHEVAPYVLSGRDVETIPAKSGAIFAISSGMMTENTLSNIWARKILPDPKQSLFFVGYSDPESPAGRLRRSKPGDDIILHQDLPPVKLRCQVEEFNFSAHSSRERLLEYAVRLAPKKIVLVHGDQPAIEWFRGELGRKLPNSEVIVPIPGVAHDL